MLEIKQVHPNSLGEELELAPGDAILQVNGRLIRDPLDFQFWFTDEEITLLVRQKATGQHIEYVLEKEYDEPLGVDFVEPTYEQCKNKCVFCFVHQQPAGMRPELYFEDDDYRLSFSHGNYITLTNMTPADFERIVEQRLSPIYISVHTTNPKLRRRMIAHRDADKILEHLQFFAENRIEMHTQIVLCPGINDGEHLEKTVEDLARFYPHVSSIAVVPVGLTKYRHERRLRKINPVTPEFAQQLITQGFAWQQRFRKEFGTGFIYLADEFFLKAGQPFPESDYYDDLSQIEDGVGMARLFIDDFAAVQHTLPSRIESPRQVTFVTAVMPATFIADVVQCFNRIENLSVQMVVVENEFWGEDVTVSGLLIARDILNAVKASPPGDLILLPANVVNHDGLFLDNISLEAFQQKARTEVQLGEKDMERMCQQVLGTYHSPWKSRYDGIQNAVAWRT
ncbi:MAG: DUF512 domain-containing protein [Gemmatimonadetes bacterium]|nr:MAG: DUF512 domain-containing protein [Gemmatimonadota bacterium]